MQLLDSYAQDLDGLYVPLEPEGFPDPQLLLLNHGLTAELGLDPDGLTAELLTGSAVPEGVRPLAMAYAGHQFGGFSPQLGDGRALLLGEVVDPAGRRFDVHLKGSGRTPFARGGDGKSPLGPALREYVLGEAMHHLGIPTTRGLAVATTGEQVRRQRWEPGAVLARVASSHIRVGTFEFFAARRDYDKVERLLSYTLQRHVPDGVGADRPAQVLLEHVARAQASLIARWMQVGFVHGVMNTDNTTVSGETLDYGPCAFLDRYDPAAVFSSIDHAGRYAFGRQPQIGLWNLARLAEALGPLLGSDARRAGEAAQGALDLYRGTYDRAFLEGMGAKLGLTSVEAGDLDLVTSLLEDMHTLQLDFTDTFRRLAGALRSPLVALTLPGLGAWLARFQQRVAGDPDAPARMDAVNPIYIPRNHLVEAALEAALGGDLGPAERLVAVLSSPFTEQPGAEAYARPAPADFGPYTTFCGT